MYTCYGTRDVIPVIGKDFADHTHLILESNKGSKGENMWGSETNPENSHNPFATFSQKYILALLAYSVH